MANLEERQYRRLYSSLKWSREQMRYYRDERISAVKQLVGTHYAEDGAKRKVPVNVLRLAASIVSRSLVARSPQVMATTKYFTLKPVAEKLSIAGSHLLGEIAFLQTMRAAVRDALFGMGIVKTGLKESNGWEEDGYLHDMGQPFASVVDLDDFIIDMNAKRLPQITYVGHKFGMELERAMEHPAFDKKAKERLAQRAKNDDPPHSDDDISGISKGSGWRDEEYKEYVDLYEFWLPLDNLTMVCSAQEVDDGSYVGRPLLVTEWTGPEQGPYDYLGFEEVPGNLLPLPPAAMWQDMHEFINVLWRKLQNKSVNQKTVLGVTGDAGGDANRIIEARDGEAIRLDAPDRVREFHFNGPDQMLLALALQSRDLFSAMAGNLDTLGGIATQADTYGQEKLLSETASKQISEMQDRTVEFTTDIVRKLMNYLWNDPLIDIPLVKRIEQAGVEIPFRWNEDAKEGDFLDYNIKIAPYSMRHQTPADKLQTLSMVFQQFIAPFAPQMQAQGLGINFEGLLRTVSKLADFDELDDIIIFAGEGMQADMPVQTKPANTTRQYDRVVGGGRSNRGQTQQLVQQLMSGGGGGQQGPVIRQTA